ncbi:MAG: inositol monophosphatase family protein [Qingshengfaniella sp.]
MPAGDPQAAADLALLVQAARAAADLALGFHGRNPKTWHKEADQSPVTEADLAVDAMLRERLLAARPGYGWLSEETPDSPARLDRDQVFIVDPIDGTRDFIAGGTVWGHSLAVARGGEVTAAVVHLPRRAEVYTAARGHGAHLNGARLVASGRGNSAGGTMLTRRSALEDRHWPGGVPAMDPVTRSPMAYRLACLAGGGFDALFAPSGIWEWDLAAGALMIAEAGHVITDADGHALRFNAARPRAPGVLAASAPLHAELLVRRSGPGVG